MEGEIYKVIKVWMEGEINNFIKVWLSVFISLCYCSIVGKIVPQGTPRLLLVVPVVCLFLVLPLNLHSMHLGGTTAFFLAWLANFKLLMFAFGIGPLSDPSLSLPCFVAIACLPIKVQQNPPPKSSQKPPNTQNKHNPSLNGHTQENPSLNGHTQEKPSPKTTKKGHKSPWNYATKVVLFALILKAYDYSEYLHPNVIWFIYCFHIYFCLEIILAMVAALARTLLGLELEDQFNEPYLSTSLQDFWGRRWNIMVTRIMRPTTYEPVLNAGTRFLGRKWAPLPAVLVTFLVSALMHELIFYYLGRIRPTWEVTWFFMFHGVCLVVEVALKKAFFRRWRLPAKITGPLTVVFIIATGFWLFLPSLLRCNADVRALQEYAAVGAFVRDVGQALTLKSFNHTRI